MMDDIGQDELGQILRRSYETPVPEVPGGFSDRLRARLQRELEAPLRGTRARAVLALWRRPWVLGIAAVIGLGIGVWPAVRPSRQNGEEPARSAGIGPAEAAPAAPTYTPRYAVSAHDYAVSAENLELPKIPAKPADPVAQDDMRVMDFLSPPASAPASPASAAPPVIAALTRLETSDSPPAVATDPADHMAMYRARRTEALLPHATAARAPVSTAPVNTLPLGFFSANDSSTLGFAYPLVEGIKLDGIDADSLAQLLANRIRHISDSRLPHGRIWKGQQDFVLDGRLDGRIETFLVRFDVANGQFRAFLGEGDELPHERSARIYHGQITAGQKPIMIWRRDDVDGYAAVNTLCLISPGHFRGIWVDNCGNSGDEELELQDASPPGDRQPVDVARPGSTMPKPGRLPGVVFVSDMPWVQANAGAGNPVRRDININGRPIGIAGRVYAKGVWTHSYPDETPADVVIDVSNRGFAAFLADAGVEQSSDSGTVQFQVLVDGQRRAESPVMRPGAVHRFLVDVGGARLVTLRVLNGGDGYGSDHAVWGFARFIETGASDAAGLGSRALSQAIQGLVAWYPLDGHTKDRSGNGNDAIEHGGVSYPGGMDLLAASFDGVDDFIEIPNNRLLNTQSTIAFWVKLNDNGNYSLVSKALLGNGFGIWLGRDANFNQGASGSGLVSFGFDGKGIQWNWHMVTAETRLQPGKWHHVAAVLGDSGQRLYIDGRQEAFNPSAETPQIDAPIWIGRETRIGGGFLNGLLDEVRIYDRALSSGEIMQLYRRDAVPADQSAARPSGEKAADGRDQPEPSGTPPVQDANDLAIEIEALIDGRDSLTIQGDTIQWLHHDWAIVGRHEPFNEPTIISTTKPNAATLDRAKWFPEWYDLEGRPVTHYRQPAVSSKFRELVPPLPSKGMRVMLTPIDCRGEVRIVQQPSAENGFTLVVEFNDNAQLGAVTYKIRLTIAAGETP